MRIVTVNGRSFFFESSSSTDYMQQHQPINNDHITDIDFANQTFDRNGYPTEHYYFEEKQTGSVPLVEDEILTEQQIIEENLKLDKNTNSQSPSPLSGDKYGKKK